MIVRRRLTLPLVALVLAGCAASAPSAEAVYADYSARSEALRQKWEAEMMWPTCETPPRPGRCGLLWDRMVAAGDMPRFVHEKCQEDPAHPSDACAALFVETFRTALRQTYPRAVEADVLRLCATEPKKCATLRSVELHWLDSHDDQVMAHYKSQSVDLVGQHILAQQAAANARQAAAERQQRALNAIAAGFGGFSAGMNGTTQQTAPSTVGCASDYSCGPGFACSKAPYQAIGSCARAVTPYGVQDFSQTPRPSSVGLGQADCQFATDCPAMFQCVQGHCMRQ
jgi:hypothetical protein